MIRTLPVAFFVLFLNFYIGFHGFLFFKVLKSQIGFQFPNWFYWIIFSLTAAVYALICFENGLWSLFRLVNAYWGIIAFLPVLMVLDMVYFFRFILRRIIPMLWKSNAPQMAAGFWGPWFTFVSHLIVIAIVLFVAGYGSWRARTPVLTEYRIKTEKPVPNGKLEIILISDMHIGALIRKERISRMVTKINFLEGDIVLIAGDILDRDLDIWESENLGAEFVHLKAPFGVWAVPGNHDYYGGHIRELRVSLAECGIALLEDEAEEVSFNINLPVAADPAAGGHSADESGSFYVIGRRDRMAGRSTEYRREIEQLVDGLDKNKLLILLDHQPYNLGEAEAAGIDLQVSGHTHRGQVWPGSVITGRLYENDYGLYYKGKTAFIVTSGYGTWGPSFRIGTKPEIVRIFLTN